MREVVENVVRSAWCVLFMLIATNKGLPVLQTDGDSAFWKVNNRLPAHGLPQGVCAAAVNCRFDQGRPGPRFGVMLSPWGNPHVADNAAAGLTWPGVGIGGFTSVSLGKLTVGARYYLALGNALVMATDTHLNPGRTVIAPGIFVAAQADYILESQNFGGAVTTQIIQLETTRGYGRFSDPNGVDNCVLLTGEERDDGGVGRAWRILPNNAPQEIPLNGHDIWGAASLVQCYNGLLLLRDGNERHYFTASAIVTNTIQLNCLPAFANGDEVQVVATADGSSILGTSAPNLNAAYFVRNAGSNQISLYDTRAHAVAGGGTGKLLFASAEGSFYVERVSTQAGYYGNGAPVLLLQGTDSQSPFEVGFVAAPTIAVVSNTNNTTQILTAANHRLAPGDAVLVSGVTGVTASTTYYAVPLSNDLFQLYDTVDHALAGGATGLIPLTTSGQTGTVKKVNASGQAMAPARLGISFLQRAILVNGRCNLLIGDPNDPLHFTPMQATLNANLGENDSIVALMTMPYDTLLIIKSNNSVLALANLSLPNTSWVLQELTREYGGVASRATANVGSDRWFLSRRGVASIAQTEQGQLQGVALPKSDDILHRLESVDWLHASGACAAEWNNRVFWAMPLKGQGAGGGGQVNNNGVLVYNTVNQGWEDLWQGNLLTPFQFARLTIDGEERLTFATADGLVCWFTDDFQDAVAGAAIIPIATSLTTRGYFAGQVVLALKGEINWDTYAPDLTVSVQTSGVNEITTVLERTYDKTKYQVANAGTYDPATSTEKAFSTPHRADYAPDPGELLVATLDTFQNTTEILRMRVRDRAPQVVIENAAGACRINSVTLAAKGVQTSGQQT